MTNYIFICAKVTNGNLKSTPNFLLIIKLFYQSLFAITNTMQLIIMSGEYSFLCDAFDLASRAATEYSFKKFESSLQARFMCM